MMSSYTIHSSHVNEIVDKSIVEDLLPMLDLEHLRLNKTMSPIDVSGTEHRRMSVHKISVRVT